MDFLLLPAPLILLVHLYILEYPHANNEEYNPDLFNPRKRGLRERAKTMEDVAYFLVGKIEDKGVKMILPTYPCGQPSESLAFRTSLAKYIESLRHQSIYSSSARGNLKSSSKIPVDDSHSVAWWWKDTLIRKSLLEESSGDKFERLMLSLSTHAIMKRSYPIPPEKMSILIQYKPVEYASALARYQTQRHTWTKSASLLIKRERDLKSLRNTLCPQAISKYTSLSTSRLQQLAESKRNSLLQKSWKENEDALNFLTILVGLLPSMPTKKISDEVARPLKSILPSPLPIAAAHHPINLKKLRKPIFQPKAPTSTNRSVMTRSHAVVILSEQLENQRTMRQMLLEAISKVQKTRTDLQTRKKPASITTLKTHTFWMPPSRLTTSIDFSPEPDKKTIISLGFQADYDMLNPEHGGDDVLEKEIIHIRQSILPPFSTMPDPYAPRIPGLEDVKSFGPVEKITEIKAPPKKIATHATASSTLSPGKTSRSERRKSVRFTLAQRRSGRPSTFRVFSNEIDQLVDETHDLSTDDENSNGDALDSMQTSMKRPKSSKSRPPLTRIWTAGTPKTMQPKLRVSSSSLGRLFQEEPAIGLPSTRSMDAMTRGPDEPEEVSGFDDEEAESVEDENEFGGQQRMQNADLDEEQDDYEEESLHSMTLQEILLSTDTSNFDLLELSTEELDEEVEDTSFNWE